MKIVLGFGLLIGTVRFQIYLFVSYFDCDVAWLFSFSWPRSKPLTQSHLPGTSTYSGSGFRLSYPICACRHYVQTTQERSQNYGYSGQANHGGTCPIPEIVNLVVI